jgi:hypothetical protein
MSYLTVFYQVHKLFSSELYEEEYGELEGGEGSGHALLQGINYTCIYL